MSKLREHPVTCCFILHRSSIVLLFVHTVFLLFIISFVIAPLDGLFFVVIHVVETEYGIL